MPKHNQSATIGPVTNFVSAPSPQEEPDRIQALEKRVSTLEVLLNDVMHQIDKPQNQAKSKKQSKPKPSSRSAKPKLLKEIKPHKVAPSEIILHLLSEKPHSRIEIEANSTLALDGIKKCFGYLVKNKLIEKTTDKDTAGNSRWQLKKQ